jgi:hypothetical protein
MGSVKKVVLWVVAIAALTLGYVVQDWYRFAKYAAIDPQRGIFGDDHLEVWIDINARMPAPMRRWACKTLLDREAEVLGGRGAVPYGCDPGFDPNAPAAVMSAVMIESYLNNATVLAEGRNATSEQTAAVKSCMQADFVAKVTPEQRAALDGASPDPATMSALGEVAMAASEGCLTKAGLE